MVNWRVIGQVMHVPLLMIRGYYRVIQVDRNYTRFNRKYKRLTSSKDMSELQLRTGVRRMPSGLWRDPKLKLAKCRTRVLTSKNTVEKVGLFLFCGWDGPLTVAGAMEETKY